MLAHHSCGILVTFQPITIINRFRNIIRSMPLRMNAHHGREICDFLSLVTITQYSRCCREKVNSITCNNKTDTTITLLNQTQSKRVCICFHFGSKIHEWFQSCWLQPLMFGLVIPLANMPRHRKIETTLT